MMTRCDLIAGFARHAAVAKSAKGFSTVPPNPALNRHNSIAFLQVADETFDVGVDTRTGVNDKDYQVPFAFNGKNPRAYGFLLARIGGRGPAISLPPLGTEHI
jgi:hypothetical protein